MAPPKQPPAGEAKLLREVVKHAWLSRSFGQQCKRCGKVAVNGATLAAANQHHCKGSTCAKMLLDELGPYVRVKGHNLWRTGPYLWCAKCGSYTKRCVRGLGRQCRHGIPEAARGQLAGWKNLAAGKAPRAKRCDEPIAQARRVTLAEWLQELGQWEELHEMAAAVEAGAVLHELGVVTSWEEGSLGEATILYSTQCSGRTGCTACDSSRSDDAVVGGEAAGEVQGASAAGADILPAA